MADNRIIVDGGIYEKRPDDEDWESKERVIVVRNPYQKTWGDILFWSGLFVLGMDLGYSLGVRTGVLQPYLLISILIIIILGVYINHLSVDIYYKKESE